MSQKAKLKPPTREEIARTLGDVPALVEEFQKDPDRFVSSLRATSEFISDLEKLDLLGITRPEVSDIVSQKVDISKPVSLFPVNGESDSMNSILNLRKSSISLFF
jgi:hypothetical protein